VVAQKIQNSQSSPEQKEQCWRYHDTWFQIILQSHSDQKQYGICTKTDTQTNEIKQETQK
jgi:hypothetical protein